MDIRMSAYAVCIGMSLATPNSADEHVAERVQTHFASDNYSVTWTTPANYPPSAKLEVGHGGGHKGTFYWIRFEPKDGWVHVLQVNLDSGRRRYNSTWPPDTTPVTVRHARMESAAYAGLLRDLAVVNSAELKSTRRGGSGSFTNFWVHARLTADKTTLIRLDWAGYEDSGAEADYAKPQAAVRLAREAVADVDFAEHTLTAEERTWASEKFARDWKQFTNLITHWWVRERYIVMIGVVGDAAALPTLRAILEESSTERFLRETRDRCAYYAINAVTRLVKEDVRDAPVEEMDLEQTRRRVLELLSAGR